MFNEDELTVYDKTFQTIGVLDKEEQKKISCLSDPFGRIGYHAICHHTYLWQRCTQRR